MGYVIINGVKSTMIKGLLVQSLPPISKPLMRTSIEEIDGRDGDVVTKLGYSAYDKEMSVGLFGDFDIDEVIEFFDTEGTVIFSNEPDKFYYFQILQQIDFERLLRFRTAVVRFHVQPFKFSAVDDAFSFSINELSPKVYSDTLYGVTISAENGVFSFTGTATRNVEFYFPIVPMTLGEGEYTLKATSAGTGEDDVTLRVIGNVPTDADSFGGTYLALNESGTASLSAELTEEKTFNYVWINVEAGAEVNFTLTLELLDETVDSCKFFNRGNTISRPKITVYGAGSIDLYINGSKVFVLNIADAGYITLDGLEMNAYKGDTLMNRSVTGDFANLKLKQATNVISWTGNVTKIAIENGSRWI